MRKNVSWPIILSKIIPGLSNNELLEEFNINQNYIYKILYILKQFKSVEYKNIKNEISEKIKENTWIDPNKIIWFIKFFENLEDNDPQNQLKLYISQEFPYFWKNVLSEILRGLEKSAEIGIEINNAKKETKNYISNVLEVREKPIEWWAKLYETWPKDSNTIIINLPGLLSDTFWSLADWAYLEKDWKKVETGFTSYWWGRSSYTRALERATWNDESNSSLVWYLDYPKSWKFDTDTILDSLVENIKKSQESWEKKINIHWASIWWKLALELVWKLADTWIEVNKLFINWWALIPEHITVPWFKLNLPKLQRLIFTKWAKLEHWLKYMISKLKWNYRIWGDKFDWNDKDQVYWDLINEWEWVSDEQIEQRLEYLKSLIDFIKLEEKLKEAVIWEVIAINSVPKKWAKSDWMVSTKFPEYLKEIFEICYQL